MTSSGHVTSSVTSPIDSDSPLSYRLPIGNNLPCPVVSEIFSLKDGHRDPGTHSSFTAGELVSAATKNRGRVRVETRPRVGENLLRRAGHTAQGHVTSSVTSPIDSAHPLSYRLPVVTSRLSPVVSEIFSIENGHRHARTTCTSTRRNPGRPTNPSPRLGNFIYRS